MREHVVVNADELRDLTEVDWITIAPGITADERARVARWADGSSS